MFKLKKFLFYYIDYIFLFFYIIPIYKLKFFFIIKNLLYILKNL